MPMEGLVFVFSMRPSRLGSYPRVFAACSTFPLGSTDRISAAAQNTGNSRNRSTSSLCNVANGNIMAGMIHTVYLL